MPMIQKLTPALLPAAWLFLMAGGAMADPADPAPNPAPDPAANSVRVHHTHHVHHRHHAATASLRPPPAPADHETADSQPAPVPNENVSDVPPGQAHATQVTPSLLQLHYPHVGDGYVQGSSPAAIDDRNAAKAPGVEMQMPLK